MPYNKLKIAAMTATSEEFIDKNEIAKRLELHKRTVERLIERYQKRLKNRQRRSRKIVYLWADILKCAKIYLGIKKENIPSVAIKKAFTKQRIKELELENERLRNESGSGGSNQTVVAPLE